MTTYSEVGYKNGVETYQNLDQVMIYLPELKGKKVYPLFKESQSQRIYLNDPEHDSTDLSICL
jgi:hypothetical protein